MKKYKRLTEKNKNGFVEFEECKKCDYCGSAGCNSFENAINRLAELEDKIENGTLIDTTTFWYEKEEGKDRYKIYKLFPIQMVFDFADTKEEAEKKIKELKGGV